MLVDELEASGELGGYHLLAATRADLLRRLGRRREAQRAYHDALAWSAATPSVATWSAGSPRCPELRRSAIRPPRHGTPTERGSRAARDELGVVTARDRPSAIGRVDHRDHFLGLETFVGDRRGHDRAWRRGSHWRPTTVSVTASASAPRSATNGGCSSGSLDHTASPGLVSRPLTVVTRPRPACSRNRRAMAAVACSTKLLNGPPANAMPPVMVGVPSSGRPSSRCCTRTATGKHEYTSAWSHSESGRSEVLARGLSEHLHRGPTVQERVAW